MATGQQGCFGCLRDRREERERCLGALPHGKALALILVEPPPPVQRLSDCGSARLCLHQANNDESPVSTEKPTGASAAAAERQILVFEKRRAHWNNSWGRWGLSVPYSPQVVIISIVATTRNENNVFCTHSAGPGYSATVGGGGQQVKTHSMFKTSFVHKTKPKRINIVDCFLLTAEKPTRRNV